MSENAEDLSELIEVVYCLNEKKEHNAKQILKDDENFLESDSDEQLLLTITFRVDVKLHHFILKAPKDGRAPKLIKIFVNQPNMDFSNVESSTPLHTVTLNQKDYQESGNHLSTSLIVPFVKFQKVKNLTLFIETNLSSLDTTALSFLQPFGKSNKTITKVEGVLE